MRSIHDLLFTLALIFRLCTGRPLAEDTAVQTSSLVRRSLWQPPIGTSWQIILSQKLRVDAQHPSVSPDVDVFDIDMFTHLGTTTIASLHKLNKKVICYFSAGSYEPYRPDSSLLVPSVRGHGLDGWPGEYWLDIRSPVVRGIMATRISIAAQMGCDAIDPDNVDGYQNTNGLKLTAQDSVDFMKFLAAEAAKYNMGIGLKNALNIIPDVLPYVQFAVNEQCARYEECRDLQPFIAAGKPVFHIEYIDTETSKRSFNKRAQQFNPGTTSKNDIIIASTRVALNPPYIATITSTGFKTTTMIRPTMIASTTKRTTSSMTTTKGSLTTVSSAKSTVSHSTATINPPSTSANRACASFRDISRFSTVIKKLSLDNWVELCSGQILSTTVQ